MRRIALSRGCLLCVVFSSQALASGLRVPIDNGLGAAGAAGGAALAEDASTGFTNPAGLIRIDHAELVVGVDPAFTTTHFKGTTVVDPPVGSDVVKTGKAKGTLNVPLIAIHYSYPLKDNLVYGFSFTNPFGQAAHFEESSIVSSTVTDAQLITWNIANSLGYAFNDHWSLGAGFDVQRLDYANENITPGSMSDVYTKNDASDWTYGWHAGVLFQFNEQRSRIGLNYRSGVSHTGEGRSYTTIFASNPNIDNENRDFRIKFDLPPIYTASFYHHISDRWSVTGTAEYTKWNVTDKFQLENVVLVGNQQVLLDYHNSWSYGLGVFYRFNEKFRMSGGIRYDLTPLSDKYRGVEFPDSDVWVLGASGAYQFNKVVRLEIGYSHSFFREEHINTSMVNPINGTPLYATISNYGKGQLYGDVINTQLTLNLAPVFEKF